MSMLASLLLASTLAAPPPPLENPAGKPGAASPFVWFEGEAPSRTNFPPAEQNPFGPANPTEAAVLSGGKWIGLTGPRTETKFLEYTVQVPADATYTLYARKFWQHGPYRWRFNDGPWTQVGKNVPLLDDAPLRLHVGANWTEAGTAALKKGTATLRIELTENDGAACFDCFALVSGPFEPVGLRRPGQRLNRAPNGWFPFEPDGDAFGPSPIDLRSMNEKFAGENGWIKVKGEDFVHEKTGQTVRFWAVNAGPGVVNLSKPKVDRLARMLAKYGVNMIRLHGAVWEGEDFTQVDRAFLDKMHYFVHAMKREGIYSCLSIYFPLWIDIQDRSGFLGYNGKRPFALLFFEPRFQQVYRDWWKEVLTTKNPYSGVPMANDPAVAILEMVNEDSYLFWTFTPYENIPEQQMPTLERAFGSWLAKRYGSIAAAFTAWGNPARIRGDVPDQGRVGFAPLWNVFNERTRRHQDQAEFLARHQRDFFQATQNYLKNDLGYGGLTYASNWVTADARVLGPLDKWSNTVADVMDRHGYFEGFHEGDGAAFSVRDGQRYNDRSALRFDGVDPAKPKEFALPLFDVRYDRKPSLITEVNWPTPNRHRADLPLVAAAYGRLQGLDGIFFFALAGPGWMSTTSKFPVQTPVTLGQFPATAIAYRRGDIQEGPVVVEANLELKRLFALEGAPVSAPLSLDLTRSVDVPADRAAPVQRLDQMDPLAFLVGRVGINFVDKPTPSQTADLGRFINRATSRVQSATRELNWDYGLGLVRVDTPRTQGVAGFLREAGTIETKDVRFASSLEHGTLMVTSLDGKPIAESSRLLIQAMSEDTNFGWTTTPATGLRTITDVGEAPMVVRNLTGTVALKRADAASLKVTALDHNGYPARPAGNAAKLELIPNCLYYLVEK